MSSQMDIDHDVPTVLATLRMEADPELVPLFYTMEDLWERKYVLTSLNDLGVSSIAITNFLFFLFSGYGTNLPPLLKSFTPTVEVSPSACACLHSL